ncbi:RNA polymerase sigma factor [Streptomyces sp. B1-3]|uniref:RNA polymerase sigma factor n=1 Tax=Streptomyces sp. B1-3 TaxID=3141453 RepID=UPI003D2E3520
MSQEAFDSLYRARYRALVAKAYLVVGGRRDVAEDVAQQAFEQCWRRMNDPAGPPVEHWDRWLATVTVRIALKQPRKLEVVFDPGQHDTAANLLDLEVEVQLKEVYRRVCEEMARLRQRPRRAMALSSIAGLSTAEVAQEMGLTQSTVRVYLAEARRALEPLRVELRQLGIVTEGEGERRGGQP